MKGITRISRLRGCATFRDFTWPDDLPDFGRYNLIYGWNGTGKTTLSRILRCLEKRTTPTGEVTVVIDGKDVQGARFPNEAVSVRVFNRDFIEENVFRSGGGDLPPIFVLGAESVEKQKEAERLKSDLATAQLKLNSASSSKQKAEKDFDRFCIDHAKAIKDMLRSSGKNLYNDYDKSDFKTAAEQMATDGDSATHHLSEMDRDRLLALYGAKPKPKVPEVAYSLPPVQELAAQIVGLLGRTVTLAAIQALRDDSTLAEWIRYGLGLHKERRSETCLFCQQPLPKDRLAELEAHFNAEYERFLKRIDNQIQSLESARRQVDELRIPLRVELIDDLADEYETAKTRLDDVLRAIREFFDAGIKALKDKKHRVFKQVQWTPEVSQIDAQVVEKLNAVIRKHNQACDEFQTRVDEARERLARGMIADALGEFISLRDAVHQATGDLDAAKEEFQRLKTEITCLEREIIEHRRPAEELNKDLCKYLGHDEIYLEIKDTGYTITRGGNPAQALSEGEMTAIALLYFLKSLEDRRFEFLNSIVILDDPVSSLDVNALYLAFGFIRERIQNAGQLIILTHNFTFFRQVRNWFQHLKGQNKRDITQRPARFYMLECGRGKNGRCSTLRQLDPLLEQYESEYHYLFSRVYRAANEKTPTSLEENYNLPNMARRLLETFLAFRQPHIAGELWQKVSTLQFCEAKKQRILRFLHSYSHSGVLDEPEHEPSVLGEAARVMKDLLELIKSEDLGHFDAMRKIIEPSSDAVDDEGQGTS